METFSPAIPPSDRSGSVITKPRVRVAEFGGGYRQIAADGINTQEQTVTLTWPMLSDAEIAPIQAFFEARGGHERFLYTLPYPAGETAKIWTLESWTVASVGGGGEILSLQATLKRQFGT